MTFLAKKNQHERDSHISFEEGPHIYTIDGENDYTSVTTWNHSHFEQFNADKIIEKMMNSENWVDSKYYGMTVKEIKDSWKINGAIAAKAGTKLHNDIECFYNNQIDDIKNDSVEYKYFLNFFEDYKHLKPYRTEWMIWDKDLKFAGSIDMVFENNDGTLSIYDWKRSKEIVKKNNFNKYAKTKCIKHLPDTNYWHYCLQLNVYKKLLEKNYGKKISEMYLVCLHPNYDSYQRIEVASLDKEINLLFELRKKQLNK